MIAAVLLTACATRRAPLALPAAAHSAAAPFFPQEIHQCGPAALATVLVASGVAVTPEALVPEIYVPGRRGSLQTELVAASRRHDRLPWVIAPRLDALAAEVAGGRPVLVLQNLGLRGLPRWHYAVVVEISAQRVVLRSGRRERLEMSPRSFLRTWQRAGSWGLVVLRAGEWPAHAEPQSWLRANAALEETGRREMARTNYALATTRWPDAKLAWLALGNAEYGLGRPREAERAWRRALVLAPDDAIVHNNLAQLLAERGCDAQAAQHVALARRHAPPEVRERIEVTAREIAAQWNDKKRPREAGPAGCE